MLKDALSRKPQDYQTGVAYVLLATLGWSLSGLFVRSMPELDGWQINCWRGFWTGVVLLTYLLQRYGRRTIAVFRSVPAPAILLTALFFSVGSTLYVASLTLISTAIVSVIGATAPLITALFSPWVTKEWPRRESWIASCVGLFGIFIIARGHLDTGTALGFLFAACIPITFAGQTLALRRYAHVDMVPAICVGGFVSFFLAGFIGFYAGHPGGGFAVPLNRIGLLAVMGFVQLALPLILYSWGARSVPAVTLSILAMCDVVLNPTWTWIVYGETPDTQTLVGAALVLSAVALSVLAPLLSHRNNEAPLKSNLPSDLH